MIILMIFIVLQNRLFMKIIVLKDRLVTYRHLAKVAPPFD